MKLVYAQINGFTFETGTVANMQKWWDELKDNYDFTGKVLSIWVSINKEGGVYNSKPSKTYTI